MQLNIAAIAAKLGSASFQSLTLHSLWFGAGFMLGAAVYKYYYVYNYVWFIKPKLLDW